MTIFEQLTALEQSLLLANMFVGFLGALVGALWLNNDLSNPDKKLTDLDSTYRKAHINWVLSRGMVGCVFSIVISLFAMGKFTETVYDITTILAFTLATSPFSPRIWPDQEQRIIKLVDQRIRSHKL